MPFGCILPTFLTLSFPSLAEDHIDFNDHIRPLLSDRCFTCHGFDANAREADLRLDTPEGAFTEDKHGIAPIVPGDPLDSEVWLRIISDDPDEVMPPPDSLRQLSDADKALIKRWIEQGAEYEPHWTFVKVEKPKTELANGHPIDQLVSEKLKQEELELSPLADPRTLVRRLSFDLRGLPPTPEEVEKFAANPNDESWRALVEHYLADPAYGERMAWPWLESARYADSNGFQGDRERTMWPWRDWVIEAFNKNLPYDDFTVWQIAGDLLPNATFEQKLATGFLRNHAINGEGGSIPEENRVNYVFDMAETVGTVWMGLTFNCCRCHDHKYDPLSQKEYYGLNAFFNQTPVDGGGGDPQTKPVLPVASNCLLARRLAERGVRFIQLYHRGWDHHGGVKKGIETVSRHVDKATAALVKDLKARGMLEDTLIIWGGEFARTPMAQGSGRDHHIQAFSLWMAGAGIKGGTTYGSTDELGYAVAQDGVSVHDLHATILQQLGIDHHRFTYKFQGLDFKLTGVESAKVVKKILSNS